MHVLLTPAIGLPLARLARQCWLNLPLDYPEFSFERLTVTEDQVELVVLAPHQIGTHPPIRGVIAHYKAMVSRLAGLGRSVWRPGYILEPAVRQKPASADSYLRSLIGDRVK